MSTPAGESIRLLVVARQQFSVADKGLDELEGIGSVEVVRRPKSVDAVVSGSGPDVALVDTEFTDGRGFDVMANVLAQDPSIAVLALTPDPPTHDVVARATRAGARGFVDVDAELPEFGQAIRAVDAGDPWFPPDEAMVLFGEMAEDLDVTSQERRSRLFGLVFGLVPLIGALSALLSLMWRKYLGQIGVRPIDLAVDPGTRVVDMLSVVFLLFGIFGPLLFVSSWLELLRGSPADRGPVAWLLARPRAAWLVVSLVVLAITLFIAVGPHLALVLVVGPMVGIAILARALGLSDELPEAFRLGQLNSTRAVVGGVVAIVLFLGLFVFEAMLIGPDLKTDGLDGVLAPRLLGVSAQPMRVFDLEAGGAGRDRLYLGGNADLYVLVDPCNDDEVEYVSVGRHRLVVINEVTCDTGT